MAQIISMERILPTDLTDLDREVLLRIYRQGINSVELVGKHASNLRNLRRAGFVPNDYTPASESPRLTNVGERYCKDKCRDELG